MDRYTKIPIDDITTTPETDGFYELRAGRYWAVTDNDEVLIYDGFAYQCNNSKEIMERIIKNDAHPGTKVVLIEHAWCKHNCNDYA